MVVRWEGEDPPDEGAWIDVLRDALDEETGSYWVRFYREPQGWRFDLEYRQASGSGDSIFKQADESVALHVYTRLVESGRPLDPGWRPFAPTPPPVAEAAPGPSGEARTPAARGHLPAGRRRGRRRHRGPAPPEPVRETKAESPPAPLAAPRPEPEPPPEPQPSSAPRPPGWPGLRPAIVYLPAFLLVAFAGWLARDRLQPPPASPAAPSPSATVSQEALTAEKRLAELEGVVAQLKHEPGQGIPGARPPAPSPIGATQRASGRPRTQPVQNTADAILAPTPAPAPVPTPTPVEAPAATSAPTDMPLPADVSTDAAVTTAPVPGDAAEPPSTPSPVQRGALVDTNDPDLTRPVAVTESRLRYPPLALERRLSGTVWLNALVDETGAVVEASVVRASPRGLSFEDAATRWVRTRVYRPATKQGVPVRVWLPIVVEFRLPDR